ncbi:hypothetical protein NCCNTM_44560 [Mycolicibacterium sp. NCC-Tsukiji]|uniref:ESX-1 secretion-associated protein n=1 Tax=Mycolicibacterium mucogenicum TaxID=56689 RepID=A0A4R5WM62_MYCMU|nr:ESX-1 secretion-associated protein [Mycolicibacterium mucogenicum]GCB00822.1 hypothetical protein NCCNTM_44560 [Mycolicibacterium sp. NCC-Tsukiji]
MSEPLRVTPAELHAAANDLDDHARSFASAHESAQSNAAGANLGSGLASAALAGMLEVTEDHSVEAATKFAHHSEAHRGAAQAYTAADASGAQHIDSSGI